MKTINYYNFRKEAVDKSVWKSMKVGLEIAGKWLFSIWILVILSGIIAFAVTIANISYVNPIIWIALIVVGLCLAPAITCHILRVQRDEFKALWDDKELLSSILLDMEVSRKKAVSMQIEGMKIKNSRELNIWTLKVQNWTQKTYKKVRLLHPAEAENFYTLGIFKPELASGTQPFMIKNSQELLNLIRRIHILEEIRNRWTTRIS